MGTWTSFLSIPHGNHCIRDWSTSLIFDNTGNSTGFLCPPNETESYARQKPIAEKPTHANIVALTNAHGQDLTDRGPKPVAAVAGLPAFDPKRGGDLIADIPDAYRSLIRRFRVQTSRE